MVLQRVKIYQYTLLHIHCVSAPAYDELHMPVSTTSCLSKARTANISLDADHVKVEELALL